MKVYTLATTTLLAPVREDVSRDAQLNSNKIADLIGATNGTQLSLKLNLEGGTVCGKKRRSW